ncbi:alpha/beta fold hydrolase [Sphingorhabdus sp. Alg231-15]|uniref:alpha/beta fold hydrolase n=1 Tax=Sphingorhabdus sp. Alg231-15 TaxID=1922222 RepID=UPI00307B397C
MASLKSIAVLIGLFILASCMAANVDGKDIAAIESIQTSDVPDPAVIFANANGSGDEKYKEGYFGSGDTRLHYVEAGEGPLIIFYHGFPSFWYSWFDQMEALKGRYRVVAVDALGSGLSAKPLNLEPYNIAKLAAQLDALSLHLGGDEKYILIGHDWGSVLALSYAQAYPDRLHKVVGMSAPPLNLFLGHAANDKEQQRRNQYMQRFRGTTLEMLKSNNAIETARTSSYKALVKRGDLSREEFELFENALSSNEMLYSAMNWYRANIPPFEEVSDADLWPGPNARITMPGLFIWGEEDQVFVPELIDKVDNAGTDMRTIRLEGINHWTSMQEPERAIKAIIDFLGE